MLEVKYTGEKPLIGHPTGDWEPEETRMMGRSVAISLVHERADMVLVEQKAEVKTEAEKPVTPQPQKVTAKTKGKVSSDG